MRGSTHLCILFPSFLLGSLSPLGLLQDGHDMKTSVFFCSQKILKGWESSFNDFSCVLSFFSPEPLLLFGDPHSSAAGIDIATLSSGRGHWTWEQTDEANWNRSYGNQCAVSLIVSSAASGEYSRQCHISCSFFILMWTWIVTSDKKKKKQKETWGLTVRQFYHVLD